MKKSEAHFHIVTPSFNQDKFIQQTIKSVLDQGRFSISHVVMDGNSSDTTKKILKKYEKKITWFSKKDKGQTDALNKGILFLQKTLYKENSIFSYLNSDDYYLPGAFKSVEKAFQENPNMQWLVGNCSVVNEINAPIHMPIQKYKSFLRTLYQPWLLSIVNPFPQPAVFIRGRAVEETGLFNEELAYVMDYDYWLCLQRLYGPPLFIQDTLAAFRIHSTSKGSSQFIPQFNEQFFVAKEHVHSPVLLLAHRLHNWATKVIYSIIK